MYKGPELDGRELGEYGTRREAIMVGAEIMSGCRV